MVLLVTLNQNTFTIWLGSYCIKAIEWLVARGCGGLKLTSAAIFAGRRTDDVSAGINHVKHLYPNSKLFLVGFSLGAALSLQYLAEGHTEEHRSGIAVVNQNPLTAALCVCPPWNVTRDTFEAGWITSVWMTFLAVPLKAYYLTHRTYLRKVAPDGVGGISLWELFWARNVSAFDQLFHRTHFRACGNMYECVRDYYDDVSPVHSAPCITTPTVVLTPRDDPLCKHSHAPTDPDSLGAGLVVVRNV